MNSLAAASLGAAATIVVALLAWWRFWPKDRADTARIAAATEHTMVETARALIDEVREHYEARIQFLEERITTLERTVADLAGLEPEVAELRVKVRALTQERDGYRRWAKSLEKQVRELGGHPVPLSRFIDGGST